jgi:hypothetical protein
LVLYFTIEWDKFVDGELNWLVAQGFNIKFWLTKNSNDANNIQAFKKCNKVFNELMQIIDLISIDFRNLLVDPVKLVSSCMYFVLGSKDIMGTFNFDYNLF